MEKFTIALIIILTALLVFISYKCACSESFKTGESKSKSHKRSNPNSISKELETKLKNGKINTSKKIKVSQLFDLFYYKAKKENPKITKEDIKKDWDKKLNMYKAYIKSKN